MKIEQFKDHNSIALIENAKQYSYQDLYTQIREYQEELQSDIENQDVIAILSDYSFQSIALFLALSEMPVIIVPIVPTTESELEGKLQAAQVSKLIDWKKGTLNMEITTIQKVEYPERYKEITDKGQSGLVLFSSGTTGTPKVMVHNLSELIESFAPPTKTRNLNFLLFLLFDHIGGINTLIGSLNNGSTITIPENRNPEYILELIQQEKVQILPTSPTFLNLLLMTEDFDKYDLSSLKMITYGTERMPQSLLLKLKDKIPNVRFLQTFGTSETGILKTESKSSTSLFFKVVDPDFEYKIENDQLYLKSKTQVNGYLTEKSEKFSEDGWFATGDLVETDDDGYIKIIGRINNVINVGGQKVLPKEVEDVINQVDSVLDSTVYARTNAITGQMVCADIVVPETADSQQIKKEILQVCRENLDKYKVPSKVNISHEMEYSNRFKKGNKN